MKESDLRNPKFLEELFNTPWPKWKSMKETDWAALDWRTSRDVSVGVVVIKAHEVPKSFFFV
jgi:hypothetical protein